MVTSSLPASTKAWVGAIATPAVEFDAPLPVLSGQLPAGLRGCLYRNGPGRLERGGARVGHWFDGDGGILRVSFDGHSAHGRYRYVRSAGYEAESAADAYLYAGYGSLAPGPLWQRWRTQLKNAANTSVLALPDRLLALWEGGFPHRLDPVTLETQGLDDLGSLAPNEPYSAHPKRHPRTSDIFNFGLVAGANATLNLYRSDPSGTLQKKEGLPLNGIPLIHDFALADRYLVFFVPPLRLNALPAVLGFTSFSDALMWQPQRGTEIVVVDADSFEPVAWNAIEPGFQWHFGRSYVDLDEVVVEGVFYDDFTTNQQLKQVAQGRISTLATGQLQRLRLNPRTGDVKERQVLLEHCEFPVVAGAEIATADTYLNTMGTSRDLAGELFGAVSRLSASGDVLATADAGASRYPAEPVWAEDAEEPSTGWVITVVYDGDAHASEVWIYGPQLGEPMCRLALPEVVPHSFHGAWQGA